jgi:hypothetical protein
MNHALRSHRRQRIWEANKNQNHLYQNPPEQSHLEKMILKLTILFYHQQAKKGWGFLMKAPMS